MSKTASAVFLCLLAVRPALAQQAPGTWPGRALAAFTVGVQADSAGLSQSYSLIKYVEPTPISAELPSATVPWFDGGLAVRLFRNAGVGFSVSMASRTGEAEVSATVPPPFFFGQPRSIAGVASVEHRELAAHLSGVYRMAGRFVEVAFAGGLSVFTVEKDVVTDVEYAQAFP